MGQSKSMHGVKDGSVVLVVVADRIIDWAEDDGYLPRFVGKLQFLEEISCTFASDWVLVLNLDDPTATHSMTARDFIIYISIWVN